MSFILDALRKSEHERQRSTLPSLAQVPIATPPAQLPRWALLVIGLLAAALLILGGAWWQSTRTVADVAATPPTVERSMQLPPAPTTVAPPAILPEPVVGARTPAPEPTAAARDSGLATAATPSAREPPPPSEPSLAAPSADEPALPSAAALAAEGIVVPAIRLELHRYREQPRDRFVFINGRKYVEGERLAEGPQLVSIVPTGAVLAQAGRRFLLVPE